MATESQHYNVHLKVTRVQPQSNSRGIERVVEEIINMTVKAETAQLAIAKAQRLLAIEKEDESDGN